MKQGMSSRAGGEGSVLHEEGTLLVTLLSLAFWLGSSDRCLPLALGGQSPTVVYFRILAVGQVDRSGAPTQSDRFGLQSLGLV